MTSENIEHFIAVILFNRYRRIQTWLTVRQKWKKKRWTRVAKKEERRRQRESERSFRPFVRSVWTDEAKKKTESE